MQAKDSPQHFLDTSVVRSLLLGTQAYRQYLNSNLAERPLYISNYIQMEMKRSYLMNIISFYFVLRLVSTYRATSPQAPFRKSGTYR